MRSSFMFYGFLMPYIFFILPEMNAIFPPKDQSGNFAGTFQKRKISSGLIALQGHMAFLTYQFAVKRLTRTHVFIEQCTIQLLFSGENTKAWSMKIQDNTSMNPRLFNESICWFPREVFELEISPIPIFASSFQGLSDEQVKFFPLTNATANIRQNIILSHLFDWW